MNLGRPDADAADVETSGQIRCQNSNNCFPSELCEQSQLFILCTLCFGDKHQSM